ncbi:esterase FrsA [Photobacterium sp. CCB-ST2H9]|uniref:esterase FrsA n=1 Tax=unclassified Photobacterium TaxID=2628852 RepID=UPI0020049BE7|nr:esterase FrsA [Photobacterium sp. CCB-ST2H9]UTM58029.1 esterase FrsA [Photobacterium sp. CCB-ST2H9]
MSEPSKVNLSEKLFAPRQTTKETSSLVRLAHASSTEVHNALDGDTVAGWYRVLRRPLWIWQGVDPIEMEGIFARIATAKAKRTNDELLDTVIGYKPGNWVYEWSQLGSQYQRLSREHLDKGNKEKAAEMMLKASTHYSIAAYPHLKGDELAAQAELQATVTYKDAMELMPHQVKTIDVSYQGKTFQAFIHLPRTDQLLPTVIVSGGLDTLQTELWPLYQQYLGPAGYAMITLDMPSVGHSAAWTLTEDTSQLHQALLQQVRDVPWVDHHRVAMLGIRFGGNAAIRLGFVEPTRLKTCISLGGIIHSFLSQPKLLNSMPRMYLDMFASRMGKNGVSKASLVSHMTAWSLKQQGLLGRRKVDIPMLGVNLKDDPVSTDMDNQLIAMSSRGGKAVSLPAAPLHDGYHRAMTQVVEWLKDKL